MLADHFKYRMYIHALTIIIVPGLPNQATGFFHAIEFILEIDLLLPLHMCFLTTSFAIMLLINAFTFNKCMYSSRLYSFDLFC